MHSEEYQFFRKLNICTRCKVEKAIEGKTLCLVCQMDNREQCKERYQKIKDTEEYKGKIKKRDTARYAERKAQGICTACGKKPKVKGLLCVGCYVKRNRKRKTSTEGIPRHKWVSLGICYTCGKEPILEGKGVCAKCYETRCNCISKIMYNKPTEYWKNFDCRKEGK